MTPLAKGVRTFAASMVGVLGLAVLVDPLADVRASVTALTIGAISAVLAGIAAFAYAKAASSPGTPLGKAFATFLQFVAAGVVTLGLNEVTVDAALALSRGIVGVLAAAVIAALQTFAQNTAEQAPAPAPPG
jgi:hypothetical protein